MYRAMTAEEKMEYSAKVIEAIKKEGLEGSLRVVEEYKQILSIDIPVKNNEDKKTISVEDTIVAASEDAIPQKNETILAETPMEASIYAKEHIPAVQEDLREQGNVLNAEARETEQPKIRTLEPPKSLAPNPWGESKVVLPGELNLK